MPTYAYACTVCDHRFEAQQAFSDDALTECPVCEGRIRKLFNSVGIVFKGSGFYRNDSRAADKGDKAGIVKAEKNGSDKASSDKSGGEKSSSDKSSTAGSDKSGGSGSGSSTTASSPSANGSSSGSSSSSSTSSSSGKSSAA